MRVALTVLVAVLAGVQTGCSELSQEARYEGGAYAGKPDTPYWQGEAFDGKRENWEQAIKRRNRMQSENFRQGGA